MGQTGFGVLGGAIPIYSEPNKPYPNVKICCIEHNINALQIYYSTLLALYIYIDVHLEYQSFIKPFKTKHHENRTSSENYANQRRMQYFA